MSSSSIERSEMRRSNIKVSRMARKLANFETKYQPQITQIFTNTKTKISEN